MYIKIGGILLGKKAPVLKLNAIGQLQICTCCTVKSSENHVI